jgi:hypothetical protein
VAARGDDPLGAGLPGVQRGEQSDGAVTHDGERLARASLGRHGAEPAGAEHVGGREQARDHVVRREVWATRLPSASGTRSNSACAPNRRYTPTPDSGGRRRDRVKRVMHKELASAVGLDVTARWR